MAGADATTADAVLKEFYEPGIREELNQGNMLLAQIEKNTEDVEGRRVVAALHVGRNSGVGSRLPGETLPTPGAQAYVNSQMYTHRNFSTGRIDAGLIKKMASDRGSFTRAVDSETKGSTNDLKREVNFQLYSNSNGVVAQCGTTTASTTVVLSNVDRRIWQYLHIGYVLDIGTVGSPTTVASARAITAINRNAGTITISGAAVTTTNADFIFRSGSGGAGNNQRVLTGLQTIVSDTGAVFGVDPSTEPSWASYVDANGGTPRAVTDQIFERTLDEIQIASGMTPNMIITTYGVRRSYTDTLLNERQYIMNTGSATQTVQLNGGFTAVAVASGQGPIALAADRDCVEGTAFVLNTNELTEFQESNWEFLDEDGSVLHLVPGVAAYDYILYKFHELGTLQRNAHGKIVDLEES